jgi:Fic family protein
MRRIVKYIHKLPDWPHFSWDGTQLSQLLIRVRHRQGKLLGRMETFGFDLQAEASLQTLTLEVVKSSEIEGQTLDREQVRSSLARRLGMDIAGLVHSDRHVDGVVEMMLDATQHYTEALTEDRLFAWHSALFPTGRSGMHRILTGQWRNNNINDPMQVVSGASGKEKVHFEAPPSDLLVDEMKKFCTWFNNETGIDDVIKAAIAHLWFVSVHPFDDGNGRIARAIADLQLSRADGTAYRFYSMSAQIRKERNDYYDILEQTQKGTLDITSWLQWFLNCLDRSLDSTGETLESILKKHKFWREHSYSSLNERQVLLLNRLLDGFTGKLNSSKWAKIAGCSQDTALRDIQNLIDKKILVKEPSGGRSTSYILA